MGHRCTPMRKSELFYRCSSLAHWWLRFIAENHLHASRALRFGGFQHLDRLAKLRQSRITGHGAVTGPLDSIEISRQRQDTPAHFEELLFEDFTDISHGHQIVNK